MTPGQGRAIAVALALVVVVLGAVAVLALRGTDAAVAAGPVAAAGPARDSSSDAAAAWASGTEPSPDPTRLDEPTGGGDEPAIPASSGAEDGWPVRVVDADRGVSVAGATVAWAVGNFDSIDLGEYFADRRFGFDPMRGRAATDESGFARVARGGESVTFVIASAGERRGIGAISEGSPRPLEIGIAPPRVVSVLVLDSEGKPRRSVPVAFGRFQTGSDWDRYGAPAETDGSGMARLDGLDLLPPGALDSEYGVRAFVLGPQRTFAAIDPRSPPGWPIELRLPPCGKVEVQVVDERGAIVEARGSVSFEAAPGSPPLAPGLESTELEDGVAWFGLVAVGQRLRCEVSLEGGGTIPVEANGPAEAGERVEIAVPLALPRAEGFALVPNGRPLEEEAIETTLFWRSSGRATTRSRATTAATDTDGRFRVDLRGVDGEVDLFVQHRSRYIAAFPRVESEELAGRISFDAPDVDSIIELGPIRLAPPSILARGVVVDDAGDPVAGAEFFLGDGSEDGSSGPAAWVLALEQPRSRRDGSFALRGDYAGGRFDLTARAEGRFENALKGVRTGARDLRIVLPRPGAIAGFVRLEPHLPAELLEVEVVPREWPLAEEPRFDAHELAPDGSFEIGGLCPGRFDVVIRTREPESVRQRLVVVPAVFVEGARTTVDPRLQSIDLVGRLGFLEFTARAVDAAGEPVHEARLRVFASGRRKEALADERSGRGETSFRLLRGEVDVVASAPRFVTASRLGVRGDVTLVLEKGLAQPVVVRVDAPGHVGELPCRIVAVLEPAGASADAGLLPVRAEVGADGAARLEIDDPGRFTLKLRARVETGFFDLEAPLAIDPRDPIVIEPAAPGSPASRAALVLDVTVSASALEEGLSNLKQVFER